MTTKLDYIEVNGTSYRNETNKNVIDTLEMCRKNDIRIIVDYGDVKTGRSWGEIHDITGYVGRSTGSVKIPLLVYNKRCYGGGALLDNCIIKISTTKGKRVLYELKV